MTARKEMAVRGHGTGWWEDDDPSALRRGDFGKERVNNSLKSEDNKGGKTGHKGMINGPEQCPQIPEERVSELDGRGKIGREGINKHTKKKSKMVSIGGEDGEMENPRGQAPTPRDGKDGVENSSGVSKSMGLGLNLQSFDEVIRELERREKNGALLHNEENVDLIILAIDLSPHCEMYPHPRISKIFEDRWSDLYVGEDNVASWAGKGNLGLKPKRDFRPGEILGVYGGSKTKTRGPYVLDVSQTGGPETLVDAGNYLDGISILGRINEDIHTNRCNIEFDVGGITYATGLVRSGSEFLTTYGDHYRWEHVVEIGLTRLKSDLEEYFPGVTVDVPMSLGQLRSANPLHEWIRSLVWNEAEDSCYHSTYDPEIAGNKLHHIKLCL